MIEKGRCEDPNAVHSWCSFKRDILGKENYYKNHFSLPEQHREFFEDFFDIEIR